MSRECTTCEHCGGEMAEVSLVGALQTRRCLRCSAEQHLLLHFMDDRPRDPEALLPAELVVWWRTVPPAAAEIVAVRRAFPQLAAIPLHDFMARVGAGPRFVIGTFEKCVATALAGDIEESGLDLRIELIATLPVDQDNGERTS